MLTPTQTLLIAQVRAHAIRNYCRGWDAIVEAADDADIAEVIGDASDLSAALAAIRSSGWTEPDGSQGPELVA